MATAITTDPLLEDFDGIHAAAIAELPPLDEQRRASIRALARAADPVTDAVRDILRARR